MSDNDLIRRSDAMQCCTDQLHNTALLTSLPPQSSAAWDARNAIAALPAAPTFTAADLQRAWQPIETAPKDGTPILAWDNGVVLVSYRDDENDRQRIWGKMWLDDSYDDFSCGLASVPHSPTHWMPLPAPPADLAQRVKE